MFMFRRKRSSLIRRLLKARLANETLGENEELLRTHVVSKLLDCQLESLVEIIESGSDSRTCIRVPKYSSSHNVSAAASEEADNKCSLCCSGGGGSPGSPPPIFAGARAAGHRALGSSSSSGRRSPPLSVPPHFLCCQTYRWPELKHYNELKKLPQCTCDYFSDSDDDNVYICCNPYHWSRLCGPESPPPPYRRYPDEKLRPEDRAPSEGKLSPCTSTASSTSSLCGTRRLLQYQQQGSLPTSGNGSQGNTGEWCKLAYWELQHRVGAQFPVSSGTVHVFSGATPPPGAEAAAFCLSDLAALPSVPSSAPTDVAVRRTRDKIGLGVLLSQELDGVWAYNLSEGPLFVNSPTLDEPHSRTLVVYKLPPGSCLRIFDWGRAARNHPTVDPIYGPIDSHSVRISFAKGWGPKYSRQEITACPCWLEVLLTPPR